MVKRDDVFQEGHSEKLRYRKEVFFIVSRDDSTVKIVGWLGTVNKAKLLAATALETALSLEGMRKQ